MGLFHHVKCRIMDSYVLGMILPFNLKSVPSQEFEMHKISVVPNLNFAYLLAFHG